MASDSHRSVSLTRLDQGIYRATNSRGITLDFGSNAPDGFSPVELLLAAIGGCSAVDVDIVTTRRADPERFEVTVEAEYVRDAEGNRLRDIVMTFDLRFPEGEPGDKARARVAGAVQLSHDKTCTVSRTVEAGTPIETRIVAD